MPEADPDGYVRKWVCICGKGYVFNQSLYTHKKTCRYYQESRGKEQVQLPRTRIVSSSSNPRRDYETIKRPSRPSYVNRSYWGFEGGGDFEDGGDFEEGGEGGEGGGYEKRKKAKSRGKPEKKKKGRLSLAAQKLSAEQEIEDKKLSLKDASHIIDKNSKTLVKLSQILELQEKFADREEEGIEEAKDWLKRKIVMYKNRISRRLTRLATWADDPRVEDKQKDKKFEKAYFQENKNVNVQKKT